MTKKQIIIDDCNVYNCNTEHCSLLKAKEQECEELKHKVELMMDCTSCKIDEYKQTLTDIKEIAEKEVKRVPDGETFARPEIKQILQKISECEVGNERN